MCVKSMGYWADQEAVREAAEYANDIRESKTFGKASNDDRNDGGRWFTGSAGRNPRSVLTPKPESYSGAHYAAFPTSLIAPLIRATCPSRCCPVCGAGWSPVVERNATESPASYNGSTFTDGKTAAPRDNVGQGPRYELSNVLGYRPTCSCGREDWRPGIVFDPFLGSGTTLQVARDLMLNGVGLDLAHTYLDEQAKVRAQVGAPSGALDDLPLFNLGIDNDTQNSV
jgi:hypothetical protein